MKALIFAAGRGERLRPLTDHTPKPLIAVRGKPLIQYHMEALLQAGITDWVINVSWLHQQIIDFVSELLKKPHMASAQVQFSIETDGPLETGGGMLKALPLLTTGQAKPEPFVVVNADVFTDFDFQTLQPLPPNHTVNLVLVNNPVHHPAGDFGLNTAPNQVPQLTLKEHAPAHHTYAGIGLYHPEFLQPPFEQAVFKLLPHLQAAISQQRATAQLHQGLWVDVGSVERLDALNQRG
ncbi:nucleotidyltransferase family protein [Marinicella meishanensis]|uniref:nucleotidyltransferase family protein n=1 Tax=Marinicella meishanensis TaxID=2873263 RepID=UPI001CBDF943|nr:nucleotidyltransferase family protein [Marinicella sp. NBU2979]